MKYLIFVIFSTLSLHAYSQHLNKLGKIEIDELPQMPEYRIDKINNEYKIINDSHTFDGNTYFKTPNGFITSLIVFDDQKDFIKQYNSEGKLLATILSDKIFNLKVSEDGNHLAFYNSEKLIYINLSTYKADTLSGSFVYEFVEGNKLIYFDSESNVVWYDGNQIEIEQQAFQFMEYKRKIYILSKQNIFELVGNSLVSKYEFKGSFFDAKIIDDVFYFVDKELKRRTESFTLYKTTDFERVVLFDRLDELNR